MIAHQTDYASQLHTIMEVQCSREARKDLLRGLLNQLKSITAGLPPEPKKRIKTVTTEETVYSEGHYDARQVIAELEKKIILKRDVKIELNEEIEEAEEELEAVEKTVRIKQQMDEDLKRKIDQQMFEIEMKSYDQRQKQKQKQKPAFKTTKNKTFSILPKKVLDFFS